MPKSHSYTPEEIAQLLKVSKLTVYELIKKGELPAYKVGRQMRVDREDLEAYKWQSKRGMGQPSSPIPTYTFRARQEVQQSSQIPTIISGQDGSLDILTKHMEKQTTTYRPLRTYTGSLNGLVAMYHGECDIVSTHLFDGETGQYNLPYIRRILVGHAFIVIHLLSRWAGFYVQQGNPKQVHEWQDLSRADLRIINREKGSGIRVLLEEQLQLHGLSARDLKGYEQEESNHLAVAGAIAQGKADVGIGIEHAAHLVGVEFIPLIKESYDLVIRRTEHNQDLIELVIQILQSPSFKNELQAIRGYDLSQTGQVKWDTN